MTLIYHITHIDNLQSITADGGLWSDHDCRNKQILGTSIGYNHIKHRRMQRSIYLPPGGVLGDYVPFYFAPRSPMLYTIVKRNTEYQGGQEPIVHLVSSAEAVANAVPALAWLFTEGHAEIAFSQFFNDLNQLDQIDWNVMKSRLWADSADDNDRKRRRQAEFLVHRFFPWQLVQSIGTCTSSVSRSVVETLGTVQHQPQVTIHPEWYY